MNRKLVIKMVIIAMFFVVGIIGVIIELSNRPLGTIDRNIDPDMILPLPIPVLLPDENPDSDVSDYYLIVQQGTSSFFSGLTTTTKGYNGSYLGPVMRVKRGQDVNMHVKNELDQATSVHWHGLEVPGTQDGGLHQVITPDSWWNPSFTIDQPAATLWFHPHVIGKTATQVYEGLAGLIIIEDENSAALNLPDDYGVNDIPLIIQDRSFDRNGEFVYIDNRMDGALGDYIIVNGAITPYLEVKQVNMRFRILNGANARNFNLSLSDNNQFYQIASDGGLLEKPYQTQSVFLSPGERTEIIVDFSNYQEGETIQLKHNNNVVLTFRVQKESEDLTTIPDTLATIERMDESLATSVKTIELDGMGHMVTLNGRQFDINRIDDNVALGAIEIWEITSRRTMMMRSSGHPFHIHGTQFQILSRNGRTPEAHEMGWKDTVFVNAGEKVRIIVEFKYKGIYMYHCHILEHEEAGMMGQLEVY